MQQTPSLDRTRMIAAQPAPEQAQRRYHELLDFLPDAYLLTDPCGVIQEAGPGVSALVGFARRYVIGKPLTAFMINGEQPELDGRITRLRDGGAAGPQEWEQRLRPRRHEPPIEALIRAAPVCDEGDDVIALRWLIREITAEKRRERDLAALSAELEARVHERTAQLEAAHQVNAAWLAQEQTALAECERRYDRLFCNTRDGLFRATPDGRIVSANTSLARMLAYDSPNALLAATPPPFQLSDGGPLFSRTENGPAYEETAVTGRRADGTEGRLHLRLWPVQDENEALTAIEGVAWPMDL